MSQADPLSPAMPVPPVYRDGCAIMEHSRSRPLPSIQGRRTGRAAPLVDVARWGRPTPKRGTVPGEVRRAPDAWLEARAHE